MTRKMEYGDWAQVIGTFDLGARRGAILSMLPTRTAFASLEGGEPRVRLKGLSASEAELFDLAVNPLKPSCGPVGPEQMFEEFVPVTPELAEVLLFIDDVRAAAYQPGRVATPAAIALSAPNPSKPNRLPLHSEGAPQTNVSYVLQVRPDGDRRWHTMATGLAQPSIGDVDVNQFPGAEALDIRVLQTDGLATQEVFQTRRTF